MSGHALLLKPPALAGGVVTVLHTGDGLEAFPVPGTLLTTCFLPITQRKPTRNSTMRPSRQIPAFYLLAGLPFGP